MKNLLLFTLFLAFTNNLMSQAYPDIKNVYINGNNVGVGNTTYTLEMSSLNEITVKLKVGGSGNYIVESDGDNGYVTINFHEYTSSADKLYFSAGSYDNELQYEEYYGDVWPGHPNSYLESCAGEFWLESGEQWGSFWSWDKEMEIDFTPKSYGIFDIFYRAAFEQNGFMNRDPSSASYVDEFGYPAYRLRLNITSPKDYWISNESVSPTTIEVGEPFDVSCRQYSNGQEADDNNVYVGYYLSSNNSYGSSDVLLGDDYSIIGNDSYDSESETLTIPQGTSAGTYYILFYADYPDDFSEEDENNNVEYVQITVTARPDLVVQNPNVTPTTIQANTSFSTSCQVKNQGNGSASNSKIKYYLSQNATFEPSYDTYLGWDPVPNIGSLSAGSTSSETASLDMPDWAEGSYYILFVADADNDEPNEINENNNVEYISVIVTPPPCPDLIIDDIWIVPSDPVAGENVDLYVDVKNIGDETASNTITIQYYIDGSFVGSDNITNNLSVNETNEEYYGNYVFSSEGTYNYEAVILDYADECSTNNNENQMNVSVDPPPAPDLIVINPDVTPTIISSGGSITASCIIENQGNAIADFGYLQTDGLYFYLSTDETYSSDDIYLDDINVNDISAGGEQTISGENLNIPLETLSGTYYLLFYVDKSNYISESDESNNIAIKSLIINNVGNLELICKNIDGTSSPYPSNNGIVKLYNSSNSLIQTENTDASGKAVFLGIDVGADYSCKIYHNPGGTIWGEEYWGVKESISISTNAITEADFTRNMPYITLVEVFNGATNVSGQTVAPNTELTIKVQIHNNGSSVSSKASLKLDLDKQPSYDFENSSAYQTILNGETQEFTFTYTPTEEGDYFFNVASYIDNNGTATLTDGWAWSESVFFTVGTYSVNFNIIGGSSNYNFVGDILTVVYDNSIDWNVLWQDISVENIALNWPSAIPGIHPYELYNTDTGDGDNEFWGGGQINITANSAIDLNRKAPFETDNVHYPFETYNDALNLTSNYYTEDNPVAGGQTVYIPVTVKNLDGTLSVKVKVLVNETQNFGSGDIGSQIKTITQGNIESFIFQYEVPGYIEDGTTLYSNIIIEADYGNGYILTDSYNYWIPFKVTTGLPQITEHFPESDAMNIPVSSGIEVKFNMDMDSASVVNSNNFYVKTGETNVSGSITYYPDFRYAYFQPDNDLLNNTTYTVTLTSNINNLAGNYLDGNYNNIQDGSPADDYSFSFTTINDITEARLIVPYYNQMASNWCSLTSLSMILNYYGYDVKPWQIAGNFSMTTDQGLSQHYSFEQFNLVTNDLKEYLEINFGDGSNNSWTKKTFYLTQSLKNEMISALSNNKPIWFACQSNDHAIVITGYKGTSENDSIFIHDPSGIYPLTLNSNQYINFGSTWSEFMNWVSSGGGSLFGLVKIMYSNIDRDAVNKRLSIEVFPNGGLVFRNNFNDLPKSLKLNWDGSLNSDGYIYTTNSNGLIWYPTENVLSTQLKATQADIIDIQPFYFNNTKNNDPINCNVVFEIVDNIGNVVDQIKSKGLGVVNHANTALNYYYYDFIDNYSLCNLNPGKYSIRVSLKNEQLNTIDQNTFDFSVAESDFAAFTTNLSDNSKKAITIGDTGIWNIMIQNAGSLPDKFKLTNRALLNSNDTCLIYYNENQLENNITPFVNINNNIEIEFHLETSNLIVGDSDTIIINTISNNDSYKVEYDTLVYEIVALNSPPVANAGSDKESVEGLQVALDGSGSYDPNGDELTYNWNSLDGIGLSANNVANPTFIAPEVEESTDYTFELIVSDGEAQSEPDMVTVTVLNSDINHPPVAIAGDDIETLEGVEVVLDGSASYDPDGNGINYIWTSLDGAVLSNPSIANPSFTIAEVTIDTDYRFTLRVSDGILVSNKDTVVVTILDDHVNQAPIADAGTDIQKREGTEVELNGSGSYDPDGDDISYNWTSLNGIVLSANDVVNPSFVAPEVEEETNYAFELTVNDGEAQSEPDMVIVTVLNDDINHPPVAHAGANFDISEGLQATLDGSGSYDPDGDEINYIWISLDGAALLNTTTANPIFITSYVSEDTDYRFVLQVNDGSMVSIRDTVIVTVLDDFVNQPPIANAGTDFQIREGLQGELNGLGSYDPDDDVLTYNWISLNGIVLSANDVANPTFIAPQVDEVTEYAFELTVSDGTDDSDPDIIVVTVINQEINNPPIADAGSDIQITEGLEGVLDGSGSYDPEGDEITYTWVSIDGIELSAYNIVSPTFIAPQVDQATEFMFELSVSDGIEESETDIVIVTVLNDDINHPPVADAGLDIEAEEGEQIILDGSGSYDPDGDSIEYSWISIDGIVLSDPSIANPGFIAEEVIYDSDYRFILQVNDGVLISNMDTATVTVLNSVGVEQVSDKPEEVIIYPNPTRGIVNIFSEGSHRYIILNPIGKLVSQGNFKDYTELNLSNLPKGIYFIRFIEDNSGGAYKLILK